MIVTFAGRIASGKSVVSTTIAQHYAIRRASFGDAVRREAEMRGIGNGRAALQDLGDELIAAGWDDFCARVTGPLDWNGRDSVVVDGVRHFGAILALGRWAAPSRLFSVFIDTPIERRQAWLAQRGWSEAEISAAEAHPNESGLEEVRDQADLVVLNVGTVKSAQAQIVRSLNRMGRLDGLS